MMFSYLPVRTKRSRQRRRGTSTIEFSLVLPIALLFFFSLVSFVQVFIIRNAAENAAYFGARKGIVPGVGDATIQRIIADEMRLGFVSVYTATIDRSGDFVRVNVRVPLSGNAWATGGFMPNIVTVTQECILKKQDE